MFTRWQLALDQAALVQTIAGTIGNSSLRRLLTTFES
jgi:hypothetical protein